jgi:hypothetical protein
VSPSPFAGLGCNITATKAARGVETSDQRIGGRQATHGKLAAASAAVDGRKRANGERKKVKQEPARLTGWAEGSYRAACLAVVPPAAKQHFLSAGSRLLLGCLMPNASPGHPEVRDGDGVGPSATMDGTGKARGLTMESPEPMASAAQERRTPRCRRRPKFVSRGWCGKFAGGLLFDPPLQPFRRPLEPSGQNQALRNASENKHQPQAAGQRAVERRDGLGGR